MTETTVKTVFKSLMESIKKSKYVLAPIHEAISNSLEAILQRTDFAKDEQPQITLTFDFVGLVEDKKSLSQIVVQDNGLGFNAENFSRFETLLDKTKGYNNRGSGRIQFVHRFARVDVLSHYTQNGEHFKRTFSCNAGNFVHNIQTVADPDKHRSGSTISFIPGDTLDRDPGLFSSLN